MNLTLMGECRKLEHAQLRSTYRNTMALITSYRMRGKSTRHLELVCRNITAILNDRGLASVPVRALIGVRSSGLGTGTVGTVKQ